IAWGPWRDLDLGDPAGEAARRDELRRRGVLGMATGAALAALRQALDEDVTTTTVAHIEWAQLAPLFSAARPRRLFAELTTARRGVEVATTDLRRELAALPAADRERRLLALVQHEAARVLGHDTGDAIERGRPLRELGFDSLAAVTLRDRLRAQTGLDLPATLVFDHPTPGELATFLAGELGDAAPSADAELDRVAAALADLDPENPEHQRITARLRALLDRLTRPAAATASLTAQVHAASDDELFHLLDHTLAESP
ncbi:MAG TPA: beta-ketoacyl reductase, partial [Kofleriaceae bacterium]|nr:beta-ketoacyl reductase [Kofleriaceae bacterium]